MTFDDLITIIHDELENSRMFYERKEIMRETTLAGDLRCDQLDVVCFALDIEDLHGITLPEDKLASLSTVGDLADLVMIAATVAV
ncbi:AcpP Acyl carrier protein [uncultured Caudovirales phage]|uniref:AcpP Acyl carrier protein n=1 Tax=uncultured Caudovirales phage TaxID=2100421 RepID=A0A6J7WFE4_9CAUD|nr:AcpP Acyl carrier protein [uncultured Caudovirales phage]